MNKMLLQLGINAKEAEDTMRTITTDQKNQVLAAVADHLIASTDKLLEANAVDVANAKQNHMPEGLVDRLMLSPERIEGMAEGLRQLVALEDPIGEVTGMKKRPNGLLIGQKRVPLGVVGIIYEARPNVTADAFGLCFKTGNVVILKGGSDAIHSNEAIVDCIRESLKACGITENAIHMIANCGIYAIAWQQVIKKFSLSTAYANKSVYLLWSQIWAVIIFHEQLSPQNILGILIVLFGVWTVQRYE